MAKKKRCTTKWINEQTLMEAYTSGEAYYGERADVATSKGTIRKAIQKEAACHGLKLDLRHRGGYATEVYLVPRVRGSKIPYPIKRRRPLSGAHFDGVRCRDGSGAFVPVSQCKGPVGRDAGGRFVSIK